MILRLFCLLAILPMYGSNWAEETLKRMTLEEKIGQLIIVPLCPLREDERHKKDIQEAFEKYHVGGIIIKQGILEQQHASIREAQEKSKFPLFVVADAEWGLAMRAPDAIRFPRNMTLGAIRDFSLIEQMGKEVGRQLKALGVHMNLAPVVDVNSNPLNPIIGMRSFGDNPNAVAERARLLARGMQSTGILACAKHFPGHGDTFVDSHIDLPTISRSFDQLKNVALPPFQAMIDEGIAAVMSAHIVAPVLDSLPASLSFLCMTALLQGKMGFHGLIITDGLNMEALAKNFSTSFIAKNAFKAGHHLLLYGDHIAPRIDDIFENKVPLACAAIKEAVLSGEIAEAELDARVRKLLKTKEKLGLHKERCPATFDRDVFHNEEARQLARKLYAQAMTLVQGQSETKDKIVTVLFGSPYRLPQIKPYATTVILAFEDCEEAREAVADLLSGKLEAQGQLPIQDTQHVH